MKVWDTVITERAAPYQIEAHGSLHCAYTASKHVGRSYSIKVRNFDVEHMISSFLLALAILSSDDFIRLGSIGRQYVVTICANLEELRYSFPSVKALYEKPSGFLKKSIAPY